MCACSVLQCVFIILTRHYTHAHTHHTLQITGRCACICVCVCVQCVAVCCSISMREATWENDMRTLHHTTTHYNTLQHTATHCIALQHTIHTATHCNTLHHTTPHNTTHCNTLTRAWYTRIPIVFCISIGCCDLTLHGVCVHVPLCVSLYVCDCVFVCMCVCVSAWAGWYDLTLHGRPVFGPEVHKI